MICGHADWQVTREYTEIRKTHNQGVFDVYTPAMRAARKSAKAYSAEKGLKNWKDLIAHVI